MKSTVAIALSGGIDSLVAAALLKERGHRLLGLHFLTGYEVDATDTSWVDLIDHTRRHLAPLSDQLNIPIHIIDLRTEFKSKVVDYFVRTYQQGKTPNPCLVCNPAIKFDVLFEHARSLGAERIATGHYARIVKGADDRHHLMRGADRNKDQSYFLARMTQAQLAHTIFPLSDITKPETHRIASVKSLEPITSNESQDICFIKNDRYSDFLSRQPNFNFQPGPIEDTDGRAIGEHNGLHHFTIGQRRGINCPAAQPYYVLRIDRPRNCLVVGFREHLLIKNCEVEQINWIVSPPQDPLHIDIRVRYRHTAVPAQVTPMEGATAQVDFDVPEPAVTPGQGAVFYKYDEVLGGGWIK
jgi:tRNA-specific 2-thiouridylase